MKVKGDNSLAKQGLDVTYGPFFFKKKKKKRKGIIACKYTQGKEAMY